MEQVERIKEFGGGLVRGQHESITCHCTMTFSVYLPSQAATQKPPVVLWLSGLTCTADEFWPNGSFRRTCMQAGYDHNFY
jgi:S-formylglutathione hydrolase